MFWVRCKHHARILYKFKDGTINQPTLQPHLQKISTFTRHSRIEKSSGLSNTLHNFFPYWVIKLLYTNIGFSFLRKKLFGYPFVCTKMCFYIIEKQMYQRVGLIQFQLFNIFQFFNTPNLHQPDKFCEGHNLLSI